MFKSQNALHQHAYNPWVKKTLDALYAIKRITRLIFSLLFWAMYSKTCVKRPLSKIPKIGFQDQLSLNAGPKYFRMFQGENYAILLTFITLIFVIKIFVMSFFECPL